MNANVTQMNANSAEQWAAQVRTSQVLNNPANLQPRCAKIDQKPKVHASGSQKVNTLRAMRAVQRLNRLQFDQDSTFNEQICKIFADHGALVADRYPALLFNGDSGCPQLKRQGIFIDLLQEPAAKRVRHSQRAADDPVRKRV